MKRRPATLTVAIATILGAGTLASHAAPPFAPADWPRWRGQDMTGTSATSKPPTRWSETENVKWKYKIPGFGTSTPIVLGDRVFVLTAIKSQAAPAPAPAPAQESAQPPQEGQPGERRGRRGGGGRGGGMRSETPTDTYQFAVLCLDRNKGTLLWQHTATEEVPHEGHHRDHGFASASPVTDGEHLYVSFGSRGIYCYDLDGRQKWKKTLGKMRTRNAFGEGASPAVHGDFVVINWDHEDEDFIVALDKKTGEERWRQKRDEPTSWATPVIVEHGGVTQVIVNATQRIRSYELATGKLLWECGGMTTNAIPTPIVAFDHVYALSGFRGAALLAIKLGRTGDLTGTDAITWKHDKATPYVPSALLSGERLYFFSGNNGTLSLFNAKTGKPYYESERIADLLGGVYASPVAAAGHVYLVGRDGKTVVIKDSEKLEPVSTNVLEDRFDASAALSGNTLLLRGHQNLYCIGE